MSPANPVSTVNREHVSVVVAGTAHRTLMTAYIPSAAWYPHWNG